MSQCPMSPQEHHTLALGLNVPVVVYEREPSSIIAYALSCQDYHSGVEELHRKHTSVSDQPSPRYETVSLVVVEGEQALQ